VEETEDYEPREMQHHLHDAGFGCGYEKRHRNKFGRAGHIMREWCRATKRFYDCSQKLETNQGPGTKYACELKFLDVDQE
jgi:hypothetical protein